MTLENRSFFLVLVTAMAASSSIAWADTVNSVSCATPTAALATGTSACAAIGLYGYANASASSNILLPESANETTQINSSGSVSAFLGGIRGIATGSTAESSTTIVINFETAGPLQAGYIQLKVLQDAWSLPGNGSITESLTVGSYNVSPDGQVLPSLFVPVELGADFSFTYRNSLTTYADAVSGPTAGSLSALITLQAFEADQTTPVDLFVASTPEPATLGTMALALGSLLLLVRKYRP